MAHVAIEDMSLLTAKEVCGLCNISRKTLTRWIGRGLLKAHPSSEELGRLRITGKEVKRFIQGEADVID